MASPASLPDPQWGRNKTGKFPRPVHFDPEASGLVGVGGIYVAWHAGVRPRWIYVARAADLAASFHALADNQAVMAYDINGGVYVTWSRIREEFRDGVVRYLTDSLRPLVANPNAPRKAEPIAVLAPSTKTV